APVARASRLHDPPVARAPRLHDPAVARTPRLHDPAVARTPRLHDPAVARTPRHGRGVHEAPATTRLDPGDAHTVPRNDEACAEGSARKTPGPCPGVAPVDVGAAVVVRRVVAEAAE